MKAKLGWIIVLLAVSSCRDHERGAPNTPGNDTITKGVVDSIFPVEEEIRRFKAARGDAVAEELGNASTSRDALVERFIKALEGRDTADLRALAIDAAEYIDLYYPTSIYSHPPYKQSPEINWLLLREHSDKGLRRALERYGGVPANFRGYRCKSEPRVEAANRFWEECAVQWSPTPDAPSPVRIFGSIIERNGRLKFVSYANDL